MNRRNVVLAIGTIATGTGTVLATGAFSSVSTDRMTVVNTTGDANAVLSFVVNEGYSGLSDGGDDGLIELNFDRPNQDATTTFDSALSVENNGNNDVKLSVDIENTDLDDILSFALPRIIDAGDTATINIFIDLRTNIAPTDPGDVTFVATTDF